jgi:amino acid transporter
MPFSWSRIKRLIVGCPLPSARQRHEKLNIPMALAVFASDALSSTAYASEEILLALAFTPYAVQSGLLSIPVAVAIALLMAIVAISYRQVIHAYPDGGGTYVVVKHNMPVLASQVAGAALLIDYVLTVAVSVSAGIAAITSTGLVPVSQRVFWASVMVLLLTVVNLRGIKESGKAIAVPAYIFIFSMVSLIVAGFWKFFTVGADPITFAAPTHQVMAPSSPGDINWMSLALMLALLKAFSHGCAALTGLEAVSNGVPAFQEPSAKNANRTLALMTLVLATLFLGVTALVYLFGITIDPNGHETLISRLGRTILGAGNPLYFVVQISTMVILILAANTSFAGFPILSTYLAYDGFLPRQLMSRGDRLVFSNGIMMLAGFSIALILIYHADTHALIPLYAVGVFLSFTLAQWGMVRHHRTHQQSNWQISAWVNGFGALVTGVITIVLAVEKFLDGAWLVLVAIPVLILLFRSINAHYQSVGRQLALPENGYCPQPIEHTVLVLVSSLHRGTIPALEYAKTISDRVEAVHVELNPESTERLKKTWELWGCGTPLTILKSPYRSVTGPILDYIDEVEKRYEHDLVTIIVPEFVTKQFWHNLLHNQSALLLKTILRYRKDKIITTVRYHLEE